MGYFSMHMNRRSALRLGMIGAGFGLLPAGLVSRASANTAPVLTVSTWGGITEEGIRAFVQPEFEKLTGATLAYDIGGQGARYNKLLAQRSNPPADVFLSTDEAVVSGLKADVLVPARRAALSNLKDVADWAQSVKLGNTADTVAGAPFTLLDYSLGWNPKSVDPAPQSWADLWDPRFEGKIAFAAPAHSQMPAMVAIAAELAGGSLENIDAAFDYLAKLRPGKLSVFWTDWAPLLKSGEVIAATDFGYYFAAMQDQGYDITQAAPKEGAIAVPEYVSIVKGSEKVELAEAFLNLMMDARVQSAFAEATYQGPTNLKTQLSDKVAGRVIAGAAVEKLRFFDPEVFANNRAIWTERMNLEVVPNWSIR